MAKVRDLVIRITAAPRGLERSMLRTQRQLKRLSRDVNGINRDISRLGSTFGKLGSITHVAGAGLGKLTSGARTATVAMTGAAAAAGALHGGIQLIGGLGSALAPLAGLLVAVPGAVVGAVAAMSVLRLATAGVGDAFSAAAKGDAKKFNEDLKKLAPSARSVAREFKAALPTLKGIQLVAQQKLFEPLRGEITKITATLAGPLRNGVGTVAHEFGMAAQQAAFFARSATAITTVKTVLGSVASGLRTVRPAIQPLLDGFAQIASVGARFLLGLAPAIANAGVAFGQFLSRAAQSGQALQWMQTGLAVARQLGTLLGNIGGIVASVFRAAGAAGTNFLGMLGAVVAQMNAFLKSAAGQRALESFFTALAMIGTTLGPVLAALLTQIGNLAPAVGRLAQMIGPILSAAINAIGPALAALEPGLSALFTALGQAVNALAPAFVPLATAIAQIVVALAPLLPMIATLIAQFVVALAPVIGQIATQLGPVLVQLFASLMQVIVPLLPVIVGLIQKFGEQFIKIIVALTPQLVTLVKEFGKILPIIGPLIGPVTNLVLALVPMLPVLVPLVIAVKGLGIAFGILNGVLALSPLGLIIGALVLLAAGLVLAWQHSEKFRDIVKGAWHAVLDAAGFLAKLPGKVIGFFADMVGGAIDWMQWLIKQIGRLPGLIIDALGDTGKMLLNAGKNIIYGLINGIWSVVKHLWDAMGKIASGVRSFWPFSPARTGPLSGHGSLDIAGMNMGLMLAKGMLSTRNAVLSASNTLAAAAVPAMATPTGPSLAVAPVGATMAGGGGGPIDHQGLAAAITRAVIAGLRGSDLTIEVDRQVLGKVVSSETGRRTQQQRRTG